MRIKYTLRQSLFNPILKTNCVSVLGIDHLFQNYKDPNNLVEIIEKLDIIFPELKHIKYSTRWSIEFELDSDEIESDTGESIRYRYIIRYGSGSGKLQVGKCEVFYNNAVPIIELTVKFI